MATPRAWQGHEFDWMGKSFDRRERVFDWKEKVFKMDLTLLLCA